MLDRDGASTSAFAAAFPDRFAMAMDEARGAMEGIAATAQNGDGLIPAQALIRLHEIYQLRIELEMETAGVLWRTAEVVCAVTDAIDVLQRRVRPVPLPPANWLSGVARSVVQRHRTSLAMPENGAGRATRWPDLGPPDVELRQAA